MARERALYWVDIKNNRLHRYEADSGAKTTWTASARISSFHPNVDDGFVAATRNGFAVVEIVGKELRIEPLGGPEADLPGNRFNDGTIDPWGRFWAGSMDDAEQDATGALYRLDPDRRWHRMDGDYVITNGPAISVDGGTLYHNDTTKGLVYAFDLGTDGGLSNRRIHIRIDPADGYPDGMTVDAEDCLWLAHYGGWRVARFDPSGRAIGRIDLPVANVTSCCFGGEDFSQLYITTAAKDLAESDLAWQPLAGGLFVCTPGVRGLPGRLYGGMEERRDD